MNGSSVYKPFGVSVGWHIFGFWREKWDKKKKKWVEERKIAMGFDICFGLDISISKITITIIQP